MPQETGCDPRRHRLGGAHPLRVLGTTGLMLTALGAGCLTAAKWSPPARPAGPPAPARPKPVRTPAPAAYLAYLRAELAAARGHYRHALARIRAAVAEDPDSVWLQVRLAEWLLHLGRPASARKVLLRACKLRPDRAEAWRALAQLEAPLAPARALARVRRALEIEPAHVPSRLLEALLLRRLGRLAQAAAVYRDIAAADPEGAEAPAALAYLALAKGDLRAAARWFSEQASRSPFDAEPWLGLARTRYLQGDPAGAAAALRAGLDATGDNLRLAEVLARLGWATGARQQIHWLVMRLSAHERPEDLTLVARLWLRLGAPRRAARALGRALGLDPGAAEAVRTRAEWLWRCGRWEQALAELAAVPPESRAFGEAGALRAEWFSSQRGPAVAIRALEQALAQRPRLPELWESLARAWARQGALQRALSAYRRACRLRGLGWQALEARYGRLLLRAMAGHLSPSSPALEALVAVGLDDAASLNLAGYVRVERGVQLGKAEALLLRAYRLAPLDPDLLDSIAWLRYKQAMPEQAVQWLHRALRIDPWLVAAWRHLGWAEQARGRPDRAVRAWSAVRTRARTRWQRAVARGMLRRLGIARPLGPARVPCPPLRPARPVGTAPRGTRG